MAAIGEISSSLRQISAKSGYFKPDDRYQLNQGSLSQISAKSGDVWKLKLNRISAKAGGNNPDIG
eukprot:2684909-Rhodomonas_salina.3